MVSVAVLMSTYNGQKYLAEQIDSILNQKDVDIRLFIRDDGSKDDTVKILREYAHNNSRITLFGEENVGVGNSFMNLLYSVPETFDYYAFADQDDIWLEDKLSEGVKLLKSSGKMLYASNQECVDKDNVPQGMRYKSDEKINLTPESIVCVNMLAGCTMIFDVRLYKLLTAKEKRASVSLLQNRIHDVWVAMVASLYGGIAYDSRSFIRYRQHENNVVGAYREGFFKRIKSRIKKLKNKRLRRGRSMLAKEVCEKHADAVGNYPLIKIFANSDTHKGKRAIIKNYKTVKKYTGEKYLTFAFKVLFNLF